MATSFTLPILFNYEKGRKWKIWVEGNIIYRTDGLIRKDFEKAPTTKTVYGKKSTTDEEQAIMDAKKDWVKKLDGGFKPDEDDIRGMKMYEDIIEKKESQGGNNHGLTREKGSLKDVSNNTAKGLTVKYPAMLAHKYDEKKKRFLWEQEDYDKELQKQKKLVKNKFKSKNEKEIQELAIEKLSNEFFDATGGVFVQPKLDGERCIAFLDKNEVILYSRNSKQFVFMTKQRAAIKEFLKSRPETVLDGEMYVHGVYIDEKFIPPGNDCFRFISSCCKTSLKAPNKNEELIEYHIYDIVENKPQSERLHILQQMFSKYTTKERKTLVKPVELRVAESELDVLNYHEKFVHKGYEGVILRCTTARYEGKRSLHLLKYKSFEDSEFTIVGAESAEGTKDGSVIWICQVENSDETFHCEMAGYNLTQTREMYDNYTEYLGKMLNVRYFGLNENGVPRFPKGIYFRDE